MAAMRKPTQERTTVMGGNPNQQFPVPVFSADFVEAPDLQEIGLALIDTYEAFSHLRGLTVRFLWKRKGAKSHGKTQWGKCEKPSGLTRHFADCDWVIYLAADIVKAGWTAGMIEAALFHELTHAGQDENGNPQVWAHDFDGFLLELRHYGPWSSELDQLGRHFEQPRLFAVGDESVTLRRE